MSTINKTYSFDRREPLLTIETFKKKYLHGVDLRDHEGNTYPDDMIQSFLDTAMDYVSFELNCPIFAKEFLYYEDYMIQNYKQFCYIQLPYYPLVDVTKVTLTYGYDEQTGTSQGLGIDFPSNWYKIYSSSGQLQLLPTVATINSLILRGSGYTMRVLHGQYLPQILRVEYTSGFAANDSEGIPPLLNQAIGLSAATYLLQVLGDLSPTGKAGVSSASVSIDGMSQSLSTPLSGNSNLYSATINAYNKQLKESVMVLLKKKFKRISLSYI